MDLSEKILKEVYPDFSERVSEKEYQEKVVKPLLNEKSYQEKMFKGTKSSGEKSDNTDKQERTLIERIFYISGYINNKLTNVLIDANATQTAAKMDIIRKISAMCLDTFENYGLPKYKSISLTSIHKPKTLDEYGFSFQQITQEFLETEDDEEKLKIAKGLFYLCIDAALKYPMPLRGENLNEET